MSIDEREWQAQEQALRDSRTGIATDREGTGYRRIADALLMAPPPQLPADFAQSIAAKAAKAARPELAVVDTRLEAQLTMLMTALLVLAGLACAWAYGRDWLSPVLALLPATPTMPLRLALAIGGCAVLSWALDALRGHKPQQR